MTIKLTNKLTEICNTNNELNNLDNAYPMHNSKMVWGGVILMVTMNGLNFSLWPNSEVKVENCVRANFSNGNGNYALGR